MCTNVTAWTVEETRTLVFPQSRLIWLHQKHFATKLFVIMHFCFNRQQKLVEREKRFMEQQKKKLEKDAQRMLKKEQKIAVKLS